MAKRKNCCLISFSVFVAILVVGIGGFFLNLELNYNVDRFTEQEHLERIEKLAKKKYINDKYPFEGCKVYPLYDAKDEFRYALIEFEKEGFVYVWINIYEPFYVWIMSMYGLSADDYHDDPWRRYDIAPGEKAERYLKNGNKRVYYDIKWQVDENGNHVDYYVSPYKAAEVTNEKMYLLEVKQGHDNGYIPAVRRGDKYLNLMSMKEFEYVPTSDEEQFETAFDIGFYKYRDLD